MKTPFSVEQFLKVFADYNVAVFPMQVIFYIISIASLYFVARLKSPSDKIISGLLSFFWLWMGIVYHLIFFATINKAAYLFGAVFILQGILFFISGILKNKLSFRIHHNVYSVTGLALILFALMGYPVLGYFNGHRFPSIPTFGLPCPTTIFTFGLFLLADKKIPLMILIIPLIWSFIGFTAVFSFGISEDTALLVAGLLSFSMITIRNRKMSNKHSFNELQADTSNVKI